MAFRIGIGYDNHFLTSKKNGEIKIGGVSVPCDFALVAHSDGDAVFHAVADALLGAAGLGDIGMYFSDRDPKNKGMDSAIILREIVAKVRSADYEIRNVDLIVFCEHVRIAPIRDGILLNLQTILGSKNVNIKSKHYEEARNEIACQAIALLAQTRG